MVIFFYIFYASSHHQATFRLAEDLKKKGYRVVYGGPAHLRELVVSNGFEFMSVHSPLVPAPLTYHLAKSKKTCKLFRVAFLNNGIPFKDELMDLNPALVILDITFYHYSFDFLHLGLKLALAQTMVSLASGTNIPPVNSRFVPGKQWWSPILSAILWKRSLSGQRMKAFVFKLKFGTDEQALVCEKLKRLGLAPDLVNFKQYLHFNIRSVPEIVFPPLEFDFQRKSIPANQYFVGLNNRTFENRRDSFSDEYRNAESRIRQRPVIYCAFGTLAMGHLEIITPFFQKLISVFRDLKEYNLVIASGMPAYINLGLQDAGDNVFLMGNVPQIELLANARVFITHGGVNSIMESIMKTVPMLVYPIADALDQHGNAARISYHKIGLTGDIRQDTSTAIRKKITCLLNDRTYQANLGNLRSRIVSNEQYQNPSQLITRIFQDFYSEAGFKEVVDL